MHRQASLATILGPDTMVPSKADHRLFGLSLRRPASSYSVWTRSAAVALQYRPGLDNSRPVARYRLLLERIRPARFRCAASRPSAGALRLVPGCPGQSVAALRSRE